ncbi:MAG: hypothetical protein IJN05_12685, partial [Ruminococcus sp.]|nr:hypothetical protein [Ruminococcus sp.]
VQVHDCFLEFFTVSWTFLSSHFFFLLTFYSIIPCTSFLVYFFSIAPYSDTIGTADIVDSVASVVSIIDNAPTVPEELERYIEAQRAAQNAGLLIGAAVAAIELLSERLEEMKADAEDIDMDIS